ncbi:PLP-dependent aminotransferase family protein [Kutzneria viridogrisea]|uniref:GntR family regulator n=2 Tax=Kutzneria TaxID=43356 RepID=W5W9C8_9PSEU|nr:PLP-dependent aminotransferase family protein [Kutzneria albida]AHH94799.1 GntR family regulator [Kutzneria albida DSM 43870]MBA8930468.1 GntR family transcriptional regulator/MocR family aminotransferase [Kutzneria viridogrisea]
MANSWTSGGLELHLDLDPGLGRRVALERALREAIRSGRLTAGAQLPSSRALAQDLGLARGTVVQAYEQLLAEGYLLSTSRTSTEVAPVPGTPPSPPEPGKQRGQALHNLEPGTPDVSGFPRTQWASALRHAVATVPDEDLRYGDPRGHPALRRALAAYLARVRGVRVSEQQLIICSGFAQGLGLVSGALRAQGASTMAVENYGLRFHYEIVEGTGLRLLPVPMDADGLVVEQLPAADGVLVTPSHQMPSGTTLHPARRTALVEWARERGALVIEDDYDGEFRYDRQPIGAVQGLAPEQVVYAGTASKSLAPAIRLAWLAVPHRLVEPIVAARKLAERHCPTFDQVALAHLLDSGGLDRHLRRMRAHYRKRRDLLLDALRERVPQVRPTGIAAGLHVTLLLPEQGPDQREVARILAARGVATHPLSFYSRQPMAEQGLVIGYATPAGHAFQPAVRALVDGLSSVYD